ncbi:MAG: hypothetical protein V1776_03890 [Candidatus Diapherotrites archaeon]
MELVKYTRRITLSEEEADFFYSEILLEKKTKKVVNFSVIQTYQPHETEFLVKKHDCSHGNYHIHHFYRGKGTIIEETNEPLTNELFDQAKQDILQNWFVYRTQFCNRGLDQENKR